MKYAIIDDGQFIEAKKLAEREHWFWGTQWLMLVKVSKIKETGVLLYTWDKVQWLSPKKVFSLDAPEL